MQPLAGGVGPDLHQGEFEHIEDLVQRGLSPAPRHHKDDQVADREHGLKPVWLVRRVLVVTMSSAWGASPWCVLLGGARVRARRASAQPSTRLAEIAVEGEGNLRWELAASHERRFHAPGRD